MSAKKTPSNKLTYDAIGALYDVYNELGFGYQEKHYYRAIRIKLTEKGLKFKEQLLNRLSVSGKSIGRYFLDFLVEDELVLEIKVANALYSQHVKQVLNYLKANNLKLGIVAVFTKQGVIIKRVIN